MVRARVGQLGVAAGFAAMVTAALLVSAGHWQPPFAPSVTDGSNKAIPAAEPPEELQAPPAPTLEPEGGEPARDPERFYKKPPRPRRPRTEMFAGAAAHPPPGT